MGFACSLPNSEVLFEFNRSLSLGSGNSSLHGFLHGRDRIWKCCNRSGRRTGALCVQPTHSGAARAIHLRSFNRKMACLSSVFSAVNAHVSFGVAKRGGPTGRKNILRPSTSIIHQPMFQRVLSLDGLTSDVSGQKPETWTSSSCTTSILSILSISLRAQISNDCIYSQLDDLGRKARSCMVVFNTKWRSSFCHQAANG